jgi:hypothetical protein
LPLERLDLALRDLCAALEGTSCSACLTATTTEAGRSQLPSDFFNHAYQAKTHKVLDDDTFRALANATHAWCRQHDPLFHSQSSSNDSADEIAATRIAYEARRDPAHAFGRYEFAYNEPPVRPIQLSCKEWEGAWNHPAPVWLEKVVGVTPWPDGMLNWSRAIGTWVHRWLTLTLRHCQESNSLDSFLSELQRVAEVEASQVRNHARMAGIELYPWWEQIWGGASSITRGLSETLAHAMTDQGFLSEYQIPRGLPVALPGTGDSDFILSGRIDLLLIEPLVAIPDAQNGRFPGCTCWVIDFKTGAAQPLNEKRVGKGIGLQAILYALAVRALGAGNIAISLHTSNTPLKRQIELDDALANESLFRSLDALHRAGIFGMRGDAQNEYGFSPSYPMATRFPTKAVLEAKWELLHGSTSNDEETGE